MAGGAVVRDRHGAADWVLEHSAAVGVDRVVLVVVAWDANPDGLSCWPSQRRIADRARVSRQTVRRALDRLEAAGELLVRRPDRVGRGRHSRYIVVMGRDPDRLLAEVDDRWAGFAPRLFPQAVDEVVDGGDEKARRTPLKGAPRGGPDLVPKGTRPAVQSPLVAAVDAGGCDWCDGRRVVVDETNTVAVCDCAADTA